MPSELKEAIQKFVEYHNHRHYNKALGNVTLANMYYRSERADLGMEKEDEAANNKSET